MPLEAQLPFLNTKGHIVSLVGGGGKTTLMYAMARLCAAKGWRVLVTTTTHIQRPKAFWAQTIEERNVHWNAGNYAVAGLPAENGKLKSLPPDQLRRWMDGADIVLIEADGAKRLPCKAPAEHEPVILPESDIVLAVAGLSAGERPLKEVCFRLEKACALLDATPETPITPPLLAKLLASDSGGRKSVNDRAFYAVLNQVDTPQRQKFGAKTQEILQKKYAVRCILTAFEEVERA